MEIHTYEKLWLVAALVMILAFIATITYGSVGLGIAMVDDSEETVDPNELLDHEYFGDPGVYENDDGTYDVYVRAQAFTFIPSPIEVPADSEVTFHVTSPDVIHSFSVVGTNINTMVIPGEVSTMTVEFDEPGEYGVVCNEYCGTGHHDMEGVIEVVPQDEFDLEDDEAEDDGDEADGEDATEDDADDAEEEPGDAADDDAGDEVADDDGEADETGGDDE